MLSAKSRSGKYALTRAQNLEDVLQKPIVYPGKHAGFQEEDDDDHDMHKIFVAAVTKSTLTFQGRRSAWFSISYHLQGLVNAFRPRYLRRENHNLNLVLVHPLHVLVAIHGFVSAKIKLIWILITAEYILYRFEKKLELTFTLNTN